MMTTDEHRAALALLMAEAEGDLRRNLTREEGSFVHGAVEQINAPSDTSRRSRLLRLADELVPWHNSEKQTDQQRAALEALRGPYEAGKLSPFEGSFFRKLIGFQWALSPKQEWTLFKMADERARGWRGRLNGRFCPAA